MNKEVEKLISLSQDLKLLYVEDNKDARESTSRLLSRFFKDITIAVDGKDGLEKFKENRPFNLIITDINMPYINGIEMVSEIRELDKEVNILMLSANNEANYFLDAIMIGIDGYLLKPLNMKQLINQLLKTTNKISILKENEAYKEDLEEKIELRTKALKHNLYHDPLTGLKNQNALEEDLKKDNFNALYILDIDNFQNYNDIYGIGGSNEIIRYFSLFLTTTLQKMPYKIYHYQGDQFILLTQGENNTLKNLDTLIEKVSSTQIYLIEHNDTIEIDLTIGISLEKEHAIEKALMAIRDAKKNKKSFTIYNDKINTTKDSQKTIQWKNNIKDALLNDNIVPVYQPILDREQNIIKHEILMRMQKEENGEKKLISPWFFLDIAIKTKQYSPLTHIMAMKSFKAASNIAGDFSFNISFEDIINPNTIKMLKELILQYNLKDKLIFEILESENIEDYKIVKDFIKDFRALGIRIAIDDFGAGFSNFEHILEIEPDYLKIDGSMIKNINKDKKSYEFVKAIVGLTKALNIKTIAEFVHSKEVFDICYNLSVDEFQGFYFCEPILEEKIKQPEFEEN